MSLPGKLCVGILEEDNPLKSYFRFKPLLVEAEGAYIPYEEGASYPEDGCIRIVPDKNESSHFKARMRRMGLFAVVDLRDHPNENDKIRVNKNYRGDDSEHNAHIIYSDVVREPAAGMIFALLKRDPASAEGAALEAAPDTPRVLLCPEEAPLPESWAWALDESACPRLHADGERVAVDDLQRFELDGFDGRTLSFAILPPSKVERVIEPPAPRPPRAVAPVAEVRKEPEPRPVEPTPAPVEPAPPVEEKPWLSHDAASVPAAKPAPDLPPLRQALAAQSGLNPRRGRSLQEIIDEKWRHSRIDQLGHPVPAMASGQPLMSPVERAVDAVRVVWEHPDQRPELLAAFVRIEGLDSAMDASRAAARESAVNERLNELEAQRLEILADLDALKHRKADLREELKQEIRRDEAEALADAVHRTEQAQAECARHVAAAAEAKAAADSVQDALDALVDGRFEARLREFALQSHAIELLRRLDQKPAPAVEPEGCDADADELIRRVTECFADAGCALSRVEAVNLLICAAQSPILLLSGPSGSGKTTVARLLARALGIEAPRYAEYALGDAPDALPMSGKLPAMALLDDANIPETAAALPTMVAAAEQGKLSLCVALQDEGAPAAPTLLGRAFMVRLSGASADAPWQPAAVSCPKRYAPVTAESLRAAFAPRAATLPQTLLQRMDRFRQGLSELGLCLSRRTLNALWDYCAVAASLLSLETSAILDLALSQRAIPHLLASAPLPALAALPKLLEDMPRCKKLFSEALPIQL